MLPSVPGRKRSDALITRLQHHWPNAKIVHRLDMATSGLMIIALQASSHATFSAAFRKRQIDKGYLALTHGVPTKTSGRIRFPLICDWPNRPLQKIDFEMGKPSDTQWRCIGKTAHYSLLYLKPRTGRSHQLRVHLKAIGHPIIGDEYYAPPRIRDQATRLLLHACHLSFSHPITGKRYQFRSIINLESFLR